MFRNNYQGGAVVEIFSGQGKDPVAKWKLYGGPSAIHKEYNKEVKGFVYCLDGSSQTVKMQMPENAKMSLGLLQRFLVLQVNIPQCSDFSTELLVTDSEHLKRRLHLSTLHKELSATPLHARIPLFGLKRNIWSTLCIDLVSLTSELFKGFLTLDGITLCATCKVRRIFTMKAEPRVTSDHDMSLSGASLVDLIPRSCQYPPDVNQVIQVLKIENLPKADMKTGVCNSDCVSTGKSSSYRRSGSQVVVHTASGSRASGPASQTGRKGNATSDRVFTHNTAPPSDRMKQKATVESQNISDMGENVSNLHEGASGSLQPRPPRKRPFNKQQSKKPWVLSAWRDDPASADESICRAAEEGSGVTSIPAEFRLRSIQTGLSPDLQVWSSWESNEGSEPPLGLQEEVFTFSSPPHSPRRGQGQSDQGRMEMGDEQVHSKSQGRCVAQPEDDFIGSESDEDNSYTALQHQAKTRVSNSAPPRTPAAAMEVQEDLQSFTLNQTSQRVPSNTSVPVPPRERAAAPGLVPTRCLSPSRHHHKCFPRESEEGNLHQNASISVCRGLLQEVKLNDSKQHKEEDVEALIDSSHYNVHLLGSPRMHGDDDEELRMLASLKREQEEDECRASGFSASQIHQCNVSISMSSDDTSTWTHISMPANQGHHYQKEMNPLLQSNPREWMDVLSPPIMPPSQQRRSGNTPTGGESLVRGRNKSLSEEENEDDYLNLLYDPCLKCYFDPKTGKYYELA
ncbi:protein CFAP20DC [Salarias fasciatus]|uniref:protein CFAP20DC n=1 Tax=Salarias fasciatus TaxID=181472 RepID=UPI001176E1EA|nr:uncharacterized protein C3orf67 homolog [Salarias fasciatus]